MAYGSRRWWNTSLDRDAASYIPSYEPAGLEAILAGKSRSLAANSRRILERESFDTPSSTGRPHDWFAFRTSSD
jgi:hypothetical protein